MAAVDNQQMSELELCASVAANLAQLSSWISVLSKLDKDTFGHFRTALYSLSPTTPEPSEPGSMIIIPSPPASPPKADHECAPGNVDQFAASAINARLAKLEKVEKANDSRFRELE